MKKNDGGSAFPVPDGRSWGVSPSIGMSLRDYFAGQVVAGCLYGDNAPAMASWAYVVADAMIAARKKADDK